MTAVPAIDVESLAHRYGDRQALQPLDFQIEAGEVFAFVGPNGGGKTTLFRVLSTLIPPQTGRVSIFGQDVVAQADRVRTMIGVVFQAPSLDGKLTVAENLRHQGHLYGLSGRTLADRAEELLALLVIADRRNDRAEELSGGLRRRVDLAKGLLHHPRLVLLDEPSTGLDPLARVELWNHLQKIRTQEGTTVLLTTHILDEAEKADRVGILHEGRLVAVDSPSALKGTVGGDAITVRTAEPESLAAAIRDKFSCPAEVVGDAVRLEQPNGHALVARLVEAFPGRIDSVTFSRPTLEDVFIDRTGRRFEEHSEEASGG